MASAQDEVSATSSDGPFDKLTYIQEWRDRSNYTQLHLWGMGHGVLNGDLDSSLQNSKELYDSVMSLLLSIAELLFHGLLPSIMPIKSLEYEPFLDSDVAGILELSRSTLSHSEERTTIANDIDDLAASLENEVECLTFLSPAITAPALDQPGNCDQALDYSADVPHHAHYLEIIRSKFPIAQSALVERLAKISWHRYQHICQQRVTEDTQDPDTLPVSNQDEVKSQFQDSGLGSSMHSAQIVSSRQDDAMTVMSTRAESSHKRLPSLSAEARAGEPFTCEVCYKVVIIKRTRDWRKHIFRDLLAYSCIFEHCSSGAVLFDNSAAISAHLMSEHATQLSQCSLCYEQFGDCDSSILLHFTRHMEEIALAALPPIATSDIELDNNTDSEESLRPTEKRQAVPRSHTSGPPTPSLVSWNDAQSIEKRKDIIINTELSHETESKAQSPTTSFTDLARSAYPKASGASRPSITMELTAIEDQSGLENSDASDEDPWSRDAFDGPYADDGMGSSIAILSPSENRKTLLAHSTSPLEVPHQQLQVDSVDSSPASPLSPSLPDILQCDAPLCGAQYSGSYRAGNLARHRRLKHGILEKVYQCGGWGCTRFFKRPDARLKHYRRHHPELNSSPAFSRGNAK